MQNIPAAALNESASCAGVISQCPPSFPPPCLRVTGLCGTLLFFLHVSHCYVYCSKFAFISPTWHLRHIILYFPALYQFVYVFRMLNAAMTENAAILIGQYGNLVDTGRQNKSLSRKPTSCRFVCLFPVIFGLILI